MSFLTTLEMLILEFLNIAIFRYIVVRGKSQYGDIAFKYE
jgi:hypothetical protein